jgi:GT2 family glycosyltransferase
MVSVIVLTRDQPGFLSRCTAGLLERTDYPSLELVIVDNGSVDPATLSVLDALAADARVRVVRHDAAFNFSALNNIGFRHATGTIIVLLNDDTEVIGSDWLRELVSQASRAEIGMVGARLLYPDHRVQHAGIVTGSGGALHQFRFCDASEPGPNGELALTRSVTAVTGACIALRSSVFEEVGGMDEAFTVAYGDVDLCLRVADRGYRLICTPFAELFHHESATRGYEDTPAKQARHDLELELLRTRWGSALWADRYASPAHLRECGGAAFISPEAGDAATGAEAVTAGVPRPRSRSLLAFARRVALMLRARAAPLVPNPLFSPRWYVAAYPDVAGYRLGPYQHYRRRGVRDGRDPNRLFDTSWYLERYRDVASTGMNPLDHYLRAGAREGRDPGPMFSTAWYLSAYPDVRASGQNPLLHYLRHGAKERRRPRP